MRKLKLQMQLTPDGFVAGSNGEMDWMVWDWDDELNKYVIDLTDPVDCIFPGRKLAGGFIPTWQSRLDNPETADAGARKMVETHKVVFTKTIQESTWENTELAKGELADEVNRIKKEPGKDIIVYGGGNFVSNLIKYGLIDEYHLFINQVILGFGMTIFKEATQKLHLKLIKASSFDCGIVVLCYQPA